MTRRGTLAYYLAAWVIGCFVAALLFFSASGAAGASALLLTYFFALIAGAADLLLFAFLLRRLMRLWGTHQLWKWLLAGAGLFVAMVFVLAFLWKELSSAKFWQAGTPQMIAAFVFSGPSALKLTGLWQLPIDGAATAAVLCLVDRAFHPSGEAESTQSAA
jgi:hypothetical protein